MSDDFKKMLKDQIELELDLDNIIEQIISKLDKKHAKELKEDGTYATWFPQNDMKRDVLKKLNEKITKIITKPKGGNPDIRKRNLKIVSEYDQLRARDYSQKESHNLLSAKYKLSPQTIGTIIKKILSSI